MIQRILTRNKKTYIRYNKFRKQIFSELSPKESEMVLYFLPWLLSINHPRCPGYIPDLKHSFRVFNIDNEKEIRKREEIFKRIFSINIKGSLLKHAARHYIIEGLYTIGSIGTVSQTSGSDCDIWVCFDKKQFDETAFYQLNQKINLIKDWMDMNQKMPIFFFISDINDIKTNNFGNVDSESCGSTQKNILKEEFYRTCILICGKIPLWWLCYDENVEIDYNEALSAIEEEKYGEYDIIDLGNLQKVESNEYFGAALWQFHKSLTRPLKSIIKMVLLKMLLYAPEERLICHQFRKQVLTSKDHNLFLDPIVFTIMTIFNYYKDNRENTLSFLKECFYLRCEIKSYDRRKILKIKLAEDLFKQYPISRERKNKLKNFNQWNFYSQIELGNRLFRLLLEIYREIAGVPTRADSEADKRDLLILERKISAYYLEKKYKIPVIKKPTGILNLSTLTLTLDENIWHVFASNDKANALISNKDLIGNITFIVWNNLFAANRIQMNPNPSSVTIQEIINLGTKMKDFFGIYDTLEIQYSTYLKPKIITKLLVVVSFEKSPWNKNINDFAIVYLNSWGELFQQRFKSRHKLAAFLRNYCNDNILTSYYVQRNCTAYEKIIERTKKIILPSIVN
ncbi:MAG: class I adenylate cyclase [Desulfobacterales bacterium]|nr:class I adenylate cyclase [Desulfobacterales bacterium]